MRDTNGVELDATNEATGEVETVRLDIDLDQLAHRVIEHLKPTKTAKPKTKLNQEKGFAMVWFPAMNRAKLTTQELRILLLLVQRIDRRGRTTYALQELADHMGVKSRSSAWRVVDNLVARDVLRRRGRSDIYVNPEIIWQGSLADRTAALLRWRNELDAKRDGRADGGE